MNPVYVIGHRNPDTDSICSAVAYAYLKNQIGVKAHAFRAGNLNAETQFALDFFDVQPPMFINDFYPRAKDIMMDNLPNSVHPDDSLFKLSLIMSKSKIKSIPVLNDDGDFLGIVSIGDVAKQFLKDIDTFNFKERGVKFTALKEVLQAEVLSGEGCLDKLIEGKLKIAGSSLATSLKAYKAGDVIIVGDRLDVLDLCLDIKVAGVIITGGLKDCATDEFLQRAAKLGIVVLSCNYDSYSCARLVNQSIPVSNLMQTDLICFSPEDLLDDVKAKVVSSTYRNYPVVKNNKLFGIINRNALINTKSKEVILVDHNEFSQAVEGIENTKILEIIDHHRLGGMQTNEPIFILQRPVGCTATIVTSLFEQNNIGIPRYIAGLLLSAILSDTVIFKSPTTTAEDEVVAKRLAKIANVDIIDYGTNLLRSGASLKKKTPDKLIKQDLKELHLGDYSLSISQVYVLDSQELYEVKADFVKHLEKLRKKNNYCLALLMVTDIINSNTDLLVVGDEKKLIEYAFKRDVKENIISLPGVLSRKKQLIPPIALAVNEIG